MEKRKDGIWIIDSEAITVYASAQMADILGTTPAEMIGQPSFTYIFPEDGDSAKRLFETKKRGGVDPFHFRLRRKDGSAVWVEVQGTAMYNARGQFTGIVGTFSPSTGSAAEKL